MNVHVSRLTGLDPAYPGFYPPILGQPVSKTDASFVDIIHTDGGGYGAPGKTGHADFWPNGGHAKQPGCLSATVLLTDEGTITKKPPYYLEGFSPSPATSSSDKRHYWFLYVFFEFV